MRHLVIAVALALAAPAVHAEETEYASVRELRAGGAVKCADEISAATHWAYKSDGFAYVNTLHRQLPDQHVVRTLSTLQFSDGVMVALIDAGPVSGGGCESTVLQASAMQEPCERVREQVYPKHAQVAKIGPRPVLREGDRDELAVLVDSPAGCVAVRVRMGYAGGKQPPGGKGIEAVKRCRPALRDAMHIVYGDKDAKTLDVMHGADPDKHVAAILAAQRDDDPSLVFFAATPSEAGTCDISYTRVFRIRMACDDFAEKYYDDYRPEGRIADTTVYVYPRSAGAMRSALTPVPGGGCLGLWMVKEYVDIAKDDMPAEPAPVTNK